MKRFLTDIKKYWRYAVYAARADLKAEVANSYLNWLWWILEPLCLMFIYSFIFGVMFDAKEAYFPIFIFIGLTMWDFFNKTVLFSVKSVKTNKAIVSKVYMPKYILIIEKMFVNAFKMGISFLIVVGMMIVCRVPLSINVLYFPLVILVLFVFTFAISIHLQHFGVYIEDLANVLRIALRLLFYMTGIFYNIETRLGSPWGERMQLINPMATMMSGMRKCLLYKTSPTVGILLIILIISLLLSVWGIKRIYNYENSYAKVI